MIPDYTFECLAAMPREELAQFSQRMINKVIPQEVMDEIFTFEQSDIDDENRLFAARFDAMLRMTALALTEIQQAFDDSDNAHQNSERMTRLVLWHFYALSFNLEQAVPLAAHCEQVEALLQQTPGDVPGWMRALTSLLQTYADLNG